jgi:uncharacterized protein (DUF302 family)
MLVLSTLVGASAYLSGSTVLAQSAQPDGSMTAMSPRSFGDTLTALTQAIETENLMVIEAVDGQRMLRMAGLNVPGMTQVFYFHPRYMRHVLEADPMAAMQIPLKFIVMERPDRNVVVRYFKPSTVLGRYDGQAQIAAELDGLVENIVRSATR